MASRATAQIEPNSVPLSERIQAIIGNFLLLAAWVWLYAPLADYLSIISTREDFRTNQIIFIAIIGLILHQVQAGQFKIGLHRPPQVARWPLLLALGGSLLFLVAERYLDVNTLSASIFVLASYGLCGLWMEEANWWRGLPAALLLVGVLPFGDHAQTFIGYPMRIFTAELVRSGLASAGIASLGVDTILIFENGVSHIDIPCSGVKSLWTGTIFLVAVTWLERQSLSWRWLGIALIFFALLFVANLARVTILITVGQVMGWEVLAEMLHVPLGVLGFVGACAFAAWLLRRRTGFALDGSSSDAKVVPARQGSLRLAGGLTLVIFCLGLLYIPRPQTGLAQAAVSWAFEPQLQAEPLPLKPDEQEWLTRDGAEAADRMRFTWGELSGSMILITSKTWRAHHRPERCFEVYGLTLNESSTHLVEGDLPVRYVSLGSSKNDVAASATYWFQSATQTTDDYATRIWSDLAPQRERWVLVSLLFDDEYDRDADDVQALYRSIHETVAERLENAGG